MKSKDITHVEKILGIKFSNKFLIEQAFTHKSVSKISGLNNERLEFLGDRVLGLVVASYLSDNYPEDTEYTKYTEFIQPVQSYLSTVLDGVAVCTSDAS